MNDLTDEQIEAAVQRTWNKVGSNQKQKLEEQELGAVVLNVWNRLDAVLKARFSESELDQFFHFG